MASREPVEITGTADIPKMLTEQQRVLEGMFSDPKLAELRRRDISHPAIRRYDAIEKLRRTGGCLHFPVHEGPVIEVLRQLLDQDPWLPRPILDDFWAFLPDEGTRARTVRALWNAKQFDDTLAELFVWGWLRRTGLAAARVEEKGVSDIVIDVGKPTEVRGEVKRLHADTSLARVSHVISTANRQIKESAPPGGGIAFLSLEIELQPAAPDDAVPASVEPYIEAARAAIRRHNSSVGQVVLTWEDFMTLGEAPNDVMHAVRRRSVVVEHQAPRRPPVLNASQVEIGVTAVSRVTFDPERRSAQTREDLARALARATQEGVARPTGRTRLSDHLKNPAGGRQQIGARHVVRALEEPTALVTHDWAGQMVSLATKRVETRGRDFVLFVIAGWQANDRVWLVNGAYKLFGPASLLDRIGSDPNEAFATLLERHGSRFNIGDTTGWWAHEFTLRVPEDRRPLPPDEVMDLIAPAVGLQFSAESWTTGCCVAIREDEMVVGGLHWIHLDSYRAELRSADRARR